MKHIKFDFDEHTYNIIIPTPDNTNTVQIRLPINDVSDKYGIDSDKLLDEADIAAFCAGRDHMKDEITAKVCKKIYPEDSPITFRPMDKKQDFGDLITLREFFDASDAGCFNDDDGMGTYCTETTVSNKRVEFYEISGKLEKDLKSKGITHVMWYNK